MTATDIPDFDDFLSNSSDMTNETLMNCTNEYCVSDGEYLDMLEDYIFPDTNEWVLISMHAVVFVVGVIGNFLVSLAVYRNHSMQTVTNYFIVNLAVADFLVIVVCLPATVLWDVTETWFFGSIPCKVVLFTQTTSVSVSVLTLTFISIDRWYAICYPLKFKSTPARAKTAIALIWLAAVIIAMPLLVVCDVFPKLFKDGAILDTILLSDCKPTWPEESQTAYEFTIMGLLYIAPFLFMSVAYYQIVRVLWRDAIPGSAEVRSTGGAVNKNDDAAGKKNLMPGANSSTQTQIRARRKAAKMLIAVVVMFGICYFPVHLLNVLRAMSLVENNDVTISISMLSHWLCYANSAMNPVIYNFMSGKFKKEFQRAFRCQCYQRKFRGRVRSQGTTMTYRFTSVSTHMDTFRMNSESIGDRSNKTDSF